MIDLPLEMLAETFVFVSLFPGGFSMRRFLSAFA